MQYFQNICNYYLFSNFVRNQDICLFLTRPSRSEEKFSLFHNLCSSGSPYRIINRDIKNLDEANQTIRELKSNGNKIHSFWMLTHGDEDSLDLIDDDSDNLLKLKEGLNQLEPKATIVLCACSAGKGKQSIAQKVAALAPGRKVYAPDQVLFTREIMPVVGKSGRLKGRFVSPWTGENFTKKFFVKT